MSVAVASWSGRWLGVWTRAVVVPAWRRGAATWVGCALVAAVIFGPTGMQPEDLTGLARHDVGVGAVLTAVWLLLFVPTARLIVRPNMRYLDSLPGAPGAARLVGAAALVGLQLPWLSLWLAGDGASGLGAVAATTVIAAALARIELPPRRTRPPVWRTGVGALFAVHRRALWRRASDALLRGVGLSILAGGAAALLVRNNELTGAAAGTLGASVMAVMLVPAQLGAGLVALLTHRESAWLAQSSGISRQARIAALVYTVAAVHLGAAAIAVAVAIVVAGANASLAMIMAGVAVGTALGEVRAMLVHEASPTASARIVMGAVVAAAAAVLCLAVFGAAGAVAIVALGLAALLMVKP